MPGNLPTCLCGECKKCKKREYLREYAKKNRERLNENSRRWRERHPERLKEVKRAFYERNAERLRAERLAYRDRNVEKERARWTLNNALRAGKVERGKCEVGIDCRGRLEGHHDDYAQPLEVRWFCQLHHSRHHV